MPLNELHRHAATPTRVSQVRRPLDRAYIYFSFLLLFALAAIIFVTVIQASPATSEYGVGWYLSSGQTGSAVVLQSNDSPFRPADGPDQIGFERRLYALVNQARVERGLAPLKNSESLTRAARAHSTDMANTQHFKVVDSTGRTPTQRAEDAGFRPPLFVVENISAGYADPDRVLESWVNNPNTAADLFSVDANEIGVGYAFARADRGYRHYWTIDIGKRNGLVFNVVVNNGAESTTTAQVLLHIGGEGWAQEMLVSNHPDYAGASWEPYTETKTWTLSEGTGPKKVYVKLRGPGDQLIDIIGVIALDPAAKGVKPGAGHNDTLAAPRPPLVRLPAPDVSTVGEMASGANAVVVSAATAALAPGYYQTSEFMFGKVAVGIVLPQCDGTIDKCSETWTPKMMDQVVSQIKSGTNWWVKRMNGDLSFVYDEQRQAATGYEPINHAQSDEGLWVGDVMTHLGFTGSTYFEQVYAYNNWMRQKYGTDWAFTIFVANSDKNASGTFSNGYFAYSYVPGPFTITTYDNDGYTVNNMASVIAHETGHVFGALDQYSGANVPCTATSGYLVLQNQNSMQNCASNVDSIMRGGVGPYANNLIDPFALGMVGNRTTKTDNMPDPINTNPILALSPIPSSISREVITVTGTAQDQPFASPSGNAITINKITGVKYRVDGGMWRDATPSDGAPTFNKVSQGFTFATALTPGPHVLEVQAVNRVNHTSNILSAAVKVQGADPSPAPVVLAPTAIPVPTQAPIAPTPPVTANHPPGQIMTPLYPGNNTISIPFKGYTASSLLKAINAQGGSAVEVKTWTGRNWQSYIAGGNGTDFNIEPGIGYMVVVREPSAWVWVSNLAVPFQVKMDKGWVMLGVPACRDGAVACYTASTLAAALNAQGSEVVEVNRWQNGSWSAFRVDYPFNDFPIQVGQAYFLRTAKSSRWTP